MRRGSGGGGPAGDLATGALEGPGRSSAWGLAFRQTGRTWRARVTEEGAGGLTGPPPSPSPFPRRDSEEPFLAVCCCTAR